MRLRLHHALFVGFLGVLGLLVGLTSLTMGAGLRAEFDETYRRDLTRQLDLAAALVESSSDAGPDSLARLITQRVGNRVTFIDRTGVVLGDSYVGAPALATVDNHLDRPEVQAALGGARIGFAQRTSATLGEPLLYGARLVSLGADQVVLRIAAPRGDIERAVADMQRTIALTGLLAVLLALASAYALSRAFTRPLVALADRAGRLAQGDFHSKVPLGRVVELRDLATAFNRLTEELQTRMTELEHERDEMQTLIDCMAEGVIALTDDARVLRVNRAARRMLGLGEVTVLTPIASVIRDEVLRTALEEAVDREQQSAEIVLRGRHVLLASRMLDAGGAVTTLLDISELRRLEQVRRDFVANASHELKTPLTSIRGFAETLVEDEPPPELRRQFLEAIRANTLRLQRLVDDLLDLSRLESGVWTAAREPIELAPVVHEVWESIATREQGRPSFELVGEAEVLGDQAGLYQIFRNLLENAVRHTPSTGSVRVEISVSSEEMAMIRVIDDGEGIPGRALPRIFERFYRADSSRARDAGGTGLGLAIVKHLVGAMGGDIEAHSTVPGGTTITFGLPLARQAEAARGP